MNICLNLVLFRNALAVLVTGAFATCLLDLPFSPILKTSRKSSSPSIYVVIIMTFMEWKMLCTTLQQGTLLPVIFHGAVQY